MKKDPDIYASRTEHVAVNNLMARLNIAEDKISVLEDRSEEIVQKKSKEIKCFICGKGTEFKEREKRFIVSFHGLLNSSGSDIKALF